MKRLLPLTIKICKCFTITMRVPKTEPCSAVGNVSVYRCMSDCRSRGRVFDPGPVSYFGGD